MKDIDILHQPSVTCRKLTVGSRQETIGQCLQDTTYEGDQFRPVTVLCQNKGLGSVVDKLWFGGQVHASLSLEFPWHFGFGFSGSFVLPKISWSACSV